MVSIHSAMGGARRLNFSDSYIERGKSISIAAIRTHLKTTTWGKKAYKMKPVHMLTQKNIPDWVKFGKMVIEDGYCTKGSRGRQLLDNVLWTDETMT